MQWIDSRSPFRGGFYLIGGVYILLGLYHLAVEGEGIETALETVLIVVLAMICLYAGYESTDRPISSDGFRRAVIFTLYVSGTLAILAYAVAIVWGIESTPTTEMQFMIIFGGALGAAVGSHMGLYEVQSTEELERRRDLNTLLQINQRVLRHNLRNEISVALGHLEYLESNSDTFDSVSIVEDHLQQLLAMGNQTRTITEIWESRTTVELDLPSIVSERVAVFEDRYDGVAIATSLPELCLVCAHPGLPAAIDELFENAIEHTDEDVQIEAAVTCDADTGVIEITDSGSGIPHRELTTFGFEDETPLNHSQGLGLWQVFWTVEASDGRLDISSDGTGTSITIELNRA